MKYTRATCYACTGGLVLKGGCWWIVRQHNDKGGAEYHLCLRCYHTWYKEDI